MSRDPAPTASVAVSYESGKDAAPRIAAHGRGKVSEIILRVAKEHGIPVYSDPILAEALCRFPEGDPIPTELYVAVAEVYAFLIRSRKLVLPGEKFSRGNAGREQNLPVD